MKNSRATAYSIKRYPFSDLMHLPKGAEILDIQMQDGFPVLWAKAESEVEVYETVRFKVIATGAPIVGSLGRHIATLQDIYNDFHIFEDVS